MTTAERLITVDEFSTLPDPPEGGKMELVDGRVVTMPPVGRKHGVVVGRLGRALGNFADQHALAEVALGAGFRLFPDRELVRAPDVHSVATERLGEFSDEGLYDSFPDLAVEVLSPDDRDVDMSEKVYEYLAAGTRRVWVVRPKTKSVTVHRPDGSAQTYTGDSALTSHEAGFSLDGFSLQLIDLFA